MFMLGSEYKIYIDSTNKEFPIKQTPIELAWKTPPQYSSLLKQQKKNSAKYLNKLYILTKSKTQKLNISFPHKNSRHDLKPPKN